MTVPKAPVRVPPRRIVRAHQVKVSKLRVAFFVDEYISRLDVAVNQSLPVSRCQRLSDLEDEHQARADVEALAEHGIL
jgi:hypothetical protein